MPSATRLLVVNADDFGRSPGINRGIIEAHERGIVTSASLMVRWPSAVEAAAYARQRLDLSVGLHVDIAEWVCASAGWEAVYEVVRDNDASAVAGEVKRQLGIFESLMGGPPTHLDSHQHMHRNQPLRNVLRDVTARLGVPLRHFSQGIVHCGDFHGQSGAGEPYPDGITTEALVRVIENLAPGITEIGCHPGLGNDSGTAYGNERETEVRALCDQRVRSAIERGRIQLCSFHELGAGRKSSGAPQTQPRG